MSIIRNGKNIKVVEFMDIKNSSLKETLKAVVDENGAEILTVPNKLNAILRDLCPKHSNEIDVIVNLSKNHMFDELTDQNRDSYKKVIRKAENYASAYYADSLVHQVKEVLAFTFDIDEKDISIPKQQFTLSNKTVNTTQSKRHLNGFALLLFSAVFIGIGMLAANHLNLVTNGRNEAQTVKNSDEPLESENEMIAKESAELAESEIDDTSTLIDTVITDSHSETTEVQSSSLDQAQPIGYVDVKITGIKLRSGPSSSANDSGYRTTAGDQYYVYAVKSGEGYTWYRISAGNTWIADSNGEWVTYSEYKPVDAPSEIDPTDVRFVADEWYKNYLSFLEANNHGGDTSYLIQSTPERIANYRERYPKYNAGYTFTNVFFEFDKTAFRITDLGSGRYEADCYAHVYNKTTNISTGKKGNNEVLVNAKMIYDPDEKQWLVTLQQGAKNYNYSGHEMIRYEN